MAANQQTAPDYLVIGHIAKDLTPDGRAVPGGTVYYAGLTAQRLGLQAAVATACSASDDHLLDELRDAGVWVSAKLSPATTTFTNRYDARGTRTQILSAQASPISASDLPPAWRHSEIVHLGPIAQELTPEFLNQLSPKLLGITPQGWIRSWDSEGRVSHAAQPIPAALQALDANALLVMSREDLGFDDRNVEAYAALAPITVVTAASEPATIFCTGGPHVVPAFETKALDPTGAGDVFAAALFVYYHETGDLVRAVRFGHAAAALAIRALGASGIAPRANLDEMMGSEVGN
jgi:sugar/nucleoside kinase (ribokinase family)